MPLREIELLRIGVKSFKQNPRYNRIVWYLRQLLPLTYVSEYIIHVNEDIKQVCVWKMWMGHSYNIKRWNVVEDKNKKENSDGTTS